MSALTSQQQCWQGALCVARAPRFVGQVISSWTSKCSQLFQTKQLRSESRLTHNTQGEHKHLFSVSRSTSSGKPDEVKEGKGVSELGMVCAVQVGVTANPSTSLVCGCIHLFCDFSAFLIHAKQAAQYTETTLQVTNWLCNHEKMFWEITKPSRHALLPMQEHCETPWIHCIQHTHLMPWMERFYVIVQRVLTQLHIKTMVLVLMWN